jgi:1-acyl-sn-glycerol-3-phosphate acyltransferase
LPIGKDKKSLVSDLFYKTVRLLGLPPFLVSARPVVLHAERARRNGPYILAPNHLSPYDVPCLIKETPRVLDFVSIVEVFRNPLVAWFYGNMGAMPLDRSRVDPVTTRAILARLATGRVVTMFPEGRIQDDAGSVLNGGTIRHGVFRLARTAAVPILPCVILGTRAYHHFNAWLPLRRTVFGINYGEPLFPNESWDDPKTPERQLRDAYCQLHRELLEAMKDLSLENRSSRRAAKPQRREEKSK